MNFLGAIGMPEWLVDFWTVYGDMITPILVSVMMAVLTYVAVSVKSSAKLTAARTEAQLEALQAVADKEEKPSEEVTELNEKVDKLTNALGVMSEMLCVAFKNVDLDPAIKETLNVLSNKIKYGSEEDLISVLEEEKNRLSEEVATLTAKLAESSVAVAAEKIIKPIKNRVRR